MKFKVYHIHNKPISPRHRKEMMIEWRAFANEILDNKPKAEDQDAWKAINDRLNVKEDELKEKYPVTANWEIRSINELVNKIETYGTISICLENNNPIIYLADIESDKEMYNGPTKESESIIEGESSPSESNSSIDETPGAES